ncbi:hypothetical protein [Streptomyces sp. NPDC001815]|uniref:hypothetical protein n=1 Tax=Streptomyces sp. NPDC001815 TaxID=3154526 RepID=UPI003321A97C
MERYRPGVPKCQLARIAAEPLAGVPQRLDAVLIGASPAALTESGAQRSTNSMRWRPG